MGTRKSGDKRERVKKELRREAKIILNNNLVNMATKLLFQTKTDFSNVRRQGWGESVKVMLASSNPPYSLQHKTIEV